MKINFNSFSLGLGGGNRFIFELSNALVDKGYDVSITHAGLPSLHDWFTPIKAKLIECNIGLSTRFLNKYGIHKINVHQEQEKKLIKNIPNCDVNVATYFDTAKPTLLSKKGNPVYLVQHYEPSFFQDGSPSFIEAKATYNLPLLKCCVSHWLAEKVSGQYIGNGINLEKFKVLNLDRTYDVMVMPRRISWKGNYEPLINHLRSQGLNVLVVNNLSEQELIRAYNSSKVFVFLSELEGFGYPPLEAMACGVAVVSTNCTEFLVDDKNCFVLPSKYQLDDIVTRVNWLLQSNSYRDENVKGGFETAKEYDIKNAVRMFECIWREF
jgi:glycosyltransferase involved in cell wall biosynthesis